MTKPRPRDEPLFLPDRQHERIVVVVRAVCGALAGLFVAGVTWLNWLSEIGRIGTVLLFVVVPVAFAYWAVRYGDAFWERWIRNAFW